MLALSINMFTTQSQSPSEGPLRNWQAIQDRGWLYTGWDAWFAQQITHNHAPDLAHHLQAASQAFYAHPFFFGQQECYYARLLQVFWRHVTPVACFGAAHKKMWKQDLCKMDDIVFPRLLRSIVGPPGDVDWALPWHKVLRHWNERVKFLTARYGLRTWSAVCMGQY